MRKIRNLLFFSTSAIIFGAGIALSDLETAWILIMLSACIGCVSLIWMHSLVPMFSVKQVTVPATLYWMFFLRVYLPSHVIFLENQGSARIKYITGVWIVLLFIPAGMLFAQLIFRSGRCNTVNFFNRMTSDTIALPRYNNLWFVGLLILSLSVMAYHISILRTLPIFALLRNPGQALLFTEAREESFKTLVVPGSMKYLMMWTRAIFFPLLTMLCWGAYRISRKRKWLRRGLLVLSLSLFYASITLAKGPVAKFVLALILFYWLWYAEKLSLWTIFTSVGLVFSYPFLVNFLKYGKNIVLSDILATLSGLWYRVFYITAQMPYLYFELFPIQGKFLGGRSIGLLSRLTGQEFFNTSTYVYQYFFGGRIETGYANSAFIGDLYADFGMIGVLMGTLLFGFVLQILQIYMERQPKTTWLMAVYPLLCSAATSAVSINIPVTLLSGGILVLVAILWGVRLRFSKMTSFSRLPNSSRQNCSSLSSDTN
jgi:oligosaccharide repeat unit polymerase